MATPTVFTRPFPEPWKVRYPDASELTEITSIAAQRVAAYLDTDGAKQDLTLGASSNVRVEAAGHVDLYAGEGGAVNLYETTVDPVSNVRTDNLLVNLAMNSALARTVVTAGGSNALQLLPGDSNKSLYLGDLVVRDDAANAEVQVTTSAAFASGLRVLRDLKVDGSTQVRDGLSVGADAVVGGNVLSLGDLYGRNYNLFKSSNVSTADAQRVGYAFTINDHDQLELLKYGLFSSNDEVVQKVAVFGTSTLSAATANTASYLAFDALKGIATVGNSGNAVPLVSSTPGSTFQDPTLSGTVTVAGSLVPSADVTYDLGTGAKRFRDLYLSGQTIDLGGTKIQRDPASSSVSFVDSSTQAPVAIVVDEIKIGSGASAVSLTAASAGGLANLEQTFVSTNANAAASAKAVGDLYANVSASLGGKLSSTGGTVAGPLTVQGLLSAPGGMTNASLEHGYLSLSFSTPASARSVNNLYENTSLRLGGKLDRTGGTVSGPLTVQGMLSAPGGVANLEQGFMSASVSVPASAKAVNNLYANVSSRLESISAPALVDGFASTSTALAPTANAVKTVYDALSTSISNMSAAGVASFRNRIINGDMRINQRASASRVVATGTASTFVVDRFVTASTITTGGLTISQQSLASSDAPFASAGISRSLRVAASTACTSYASIVTSQVIEGLNIADLRWGTAAAASVTVSFWLRTNAPSGSIVNVNLRNAAATLSFNADVTVETSGAWQKATVTVAGPTTGTWNVDSGGGVRLSIGSVVPGSSNSTVGAWQAGDVVATTGTTNVFATLNNYVEFTGVQLEAGTSASALDVRPHAIELYLCQRYYEVVAPRIGVFETLMWPGPGGGKDVTFPMMVRKRTITPAVTATGSIASNKVLGGGWTAATVNATSATDTVVIQNVGFRDNTDAFAAVYFGTNDITYFVNAEW